MKAPVRCQIMCGLMRSMFLVECRYQVHAKHRCPPLAGLLFLAAHCLGIAKVEGETSEAIRSCEVMMIIIILFLTCG